MTPIEMGTRHGYGDNKRLVAMLLAGGPCKQWLNDVSL